MMRSLKSIKGIRSILNITLSIVITMLLVLLPLSGAVLTVVESRSVDLLHDQNLQMMEQVSYHLSYVNQTSQSTCQMLYNNGEVRRLLYRDTEPNQFDVTQMVRRLIQYKMSNEMIESIYLYNANNNTCFGTLSHLYRQQQDTMNMLQENTDYASKFTVLSPVYNDIIKSYDHEILSYVISERNMQTHKIDHAVVVNISIDWIRDTLSTGFAGDSHMILIDRNGRIILDTASPHREKEKYWDPEMFHMASEHIGQNFTAGHEENKNVYTCVTVPDTDWMLVNIQPYAVFQEFSHALIEKILLIFLACLLIGVPIAFFTARLINRPVAQLIEHVTKQSPEAEKMIREKKDLTSLIKVFDTQKQRMDELESYRQGTEIQLKKAKLKTVLLDNGTYSKEKKVEFPGDPGKEVLVALLKIAGLQNVSQEDTQERNLLRFAVVNVAEEMFQEYGICQVVPMSGNKLAVLIWPQGGLQEKNIIREKFCSLTGRLYEILSVSISAFLDWSRNDADSLRKCYGRLTELSDYTLLRGTRCVMDAEELTEQDQRKTLYPILLEEAILQSLKEADGQSVQQHLKAFLEILSNDSIRSYRNSALQLIMSVQTEVSRINENKLIKIEANFDAVLQTIRHADSAVTVQTEILSLLLSIVHQMPYRPKQKNRTVVESVCEIIEEEYTDKSLCCKVLATRMNLSVGYLNGMFKEEYGMGIQDYLNRIRLENARKQITETEKNIAQIVESCGMETSSFYRLYKAKYGVSPREHRIKAKLTD